MSSNNKTFFIDSEWECIFRELPREKSYELVVYLLDFYPDTKDNLIKIANRFITEILNKQTEHISNHHELESRKAVNFKDINISSKIAYNSKATH